MPAKKSATKTKESSSGKKKVSTKNASKKVKNSPKKTVKSASKKSTVKRTSKGTSKKSAPKKNVTKTALSKSLAWDSLKKKTKQPIKRISPKPDSSVNQDDYRPIVEVRTSKPEVVTFKDVETVEKVPDKPPQKYKAPVFDSDKPNLRNNFGMDLGKNDGYDSELSRINEQIHNQIHKKTEWNRKPRGKFDWATLLSIVVIVALLGVIGFGLMILLSQDSFIEDGICEVKIETYEAGALRTAYTKLPDTMCNTTDDCKNILLDRGFAHEEVEQLQIRCVEK
ncbi:MAG: hypothetical protein ACMXYE_04575 [Candidatus Woesearchaeota archaeon]